MSTPCQSSPEDWFIGKDGRQYADEDILSDEEVSRARKSVLAIAGESTERHLEREAAAVRAARLNRRRHLLARRRRAAEACYNLCPVRLQCIALAMENDERHGTWGGYYEEQIAEMRAIRRAGRWK